ncbi:DUF58 domain-containing protein [Conexibacter arvalis]|uniref:Uncharacterized protein (DUF58 family) n=1 Tax=Conexibacter arvalis TaxID=912552 RepID=A0A840IF06_9ACTN|nr:DUF58 domain-containing protein [Conexibacter arvalis]MBB4663396.1 uncharacterized protein (DUF58 family) [Conexibacter arvalis]
MRSAAGIALLGLVLVACGGLFDAAPLYVPGVGFLALGLLAPAWVALAARGATVERELDARHVVEEQPVPIRLSVRSARVAPPLPVAVVEDPLLEASLRLPTTARSHRFTAVARFPRRGRVRVAPPALALGDPLELCRRRVRGRGERELLVLPRTSPVSFAPGQGADGRRDGGASALLGATATEVDGVRPYREGTPAARIHWPTLARGAGLMERRLRIESDARPLVVLDARGAASRDALDMAVRAAASLTLAFARSGGSALLLPGERRPSAIEEDLGGWPAAHVRLALVEGGDDCPAPALGGAGHRTGPLVYVAARTVERLPAAVRAAARAETLLVVPGRLDAREPVLAVAGCRGYRVASRPPRAGAGEAGR